MARPKFADRDFLDAALAIAAERGPLAATVGAIAERLGAPVGSFYHRFPSRDVLLGELWLRTVLDFQQGITAALKSAWRNCRSAPCASICSAARCRRRSSTS